jgi:hypothetical protein
MKRKIDVSSKQASKQWKVTRVDNDNVLLSIGVKLLHERPHFVLVVADGVEGEILVGIHVVDVVPDGVQGDVRLLVILHHELEVVDRVIAPLALMKSCTREGTSSATRIDKKGKERCQPSER